ncbi:MAG: hypothetical protein FJZ01_20255 [Candidatus Sericytochromatia bacterium]|nr:hypothetical protein [Candidatus Tanganyikabacteria bacterium]
MAPEKPLRGLNPRRPAFLVLERDGNWATFETNTGARALLVFTTPEKAAEFYKAQGAGKAKAVEILARGVPGLIDLCKRKGVLEYVLDMGSAALPADGQPIANLARLR